jgi:hypothetical protein
MAGFAFCGASGVVSMVLAFPCFVSGLLAIPLCGGHLLFFACRKEKEAKESGSHRQLISGFRGSRWVVVHLESVLSRTPRQ